MKGAIQCALAALAMLAASSNASVIPPNTATEEGRHLFWQYETTSMSYPLHTDTSSKNKSGKSKSKKLPPPPPPKKGKGKGGKGLLKGSKGLLKKGKGLLLPKKSKKSSKDFLPPGKGKGAYPDGSPTPAPYQGMPVAAPSVGDSGDMPSSIDSETPVTRMAGAEIVFATPYEVAFTIIQTDIPRTEDYDGLTAFTSGYLEGVFDVSLGSTYDFVASDTSRITEVFELNMPVRVAFNTSVTVDTSAGGGIPSQSELDAILNQVFVTGAADYISALGELQGNIFSTTSEITFSQLMQTTSSTAKTAGIAVGASAAAFAVLIGAVVLHRRRSQVDEDNAPPGGKFVDTDGHMTVAGDTFAGTLSMDSHTVEEGGSQWEGYATYRTAEYRASSETHGSDSEASDSSEQSQQPRRNMEEVIL